MNPHIRCTFSSKILINVEIKQWPGRLKIKGKKRGGREGGKREKEEGEEGAVFY